ncbi:MAG TPA: hypothetical protein VEQ59_14480, partial [Polyangiaceae bacterium]|nr:hypothetical protein [Polyangiaceae bacterium]
MGAGSGGGDGGGGDGGSGCSGEVSDDAACWTTEEYGVFVSSDHGDDSTATGTRQFPYKTLSKALGASGSRNIYVCVGSDDYTERVFLDRPSTAVHIYGGFECENWTYDVARRAQVTSPTQIALRIQGATKGVTIENMEFTAANGSGDNASSYGAFITDSKDVVLKRVKLTAGDGLDGADGADGEKGADGVAPGAEQNGEPALCPGGTAHSKGGVAIDALCGSKGGDGGDGVVDSTGAPGFDGTPLVDRNRGENAADGSAGDSGKPGAVGTSGGAADAGPISGIFTMTGFAPANGLDGKAGTAGQGGGGGGSSKGGSGCRGASGGAGGMGGCGGSGAHGGAGGGASVGLLSWSSTVTLVACEMV